MNTDIVPLAITMVAGPQIMSAIIFVTTQHAVRMSLAFVGGAAIGVTVGVVVAKGLASLLGASTSIGDSSDPSTLGKVIQIGLVLLLVAAAIRNFLKRATSKPPKWLDALMEADEKRAFTLGLMLLTIFPSDAIVLPTVGINLEDNGHSVFDALPFIGLTILLAALPLLAYVLFRHRAVQAMPKVRNWMESNSWLVNIIVCAIFIALILG